MSTALQKIVGKQAFEDFVQTRPIAVGLPALAYTSREYWMLENEKLFAKTWTFVGFAHELANPGDVMPVTIAGQPLVLVCNKQGTLKAFHNVCRHRCLKLVEQPDNLRGQIRCPYHSWVYSLDGELRATPFFGGIQTHAPEGFDKTQHRLIEVRCARWHDWIFVNLDGQAPEIEEFVKPLEKQLGELDFNQVRPVASLDFGEIDMNWKLPMENFIEPYHVPVVHTTTTEQPLSEHYIVMEGHCLGSAVDITNNDALEESEESTLAVSSRYLTLFPNFVLGRYFPDQLGVHLNLPVSEGRTWQKRVIYATEGEDFSAEKIESLKALWSKVHQEDHAMCERLQQGRASQVAKSGGVLSPHWETSVRRFQEMAWEALQ